MPMPLPYSIIRTCILVKPDANMVLADGDSLARVRFEGISISAEDYPDNFLLELGFFFGELGLVATIVVVIVGEIGGIKEEVLEGLGVERVGWRADLEATHQSLEEEVVEIGGVVERAHGV